MDTCKYKKYAPSVKAAISLTGIVDLFPDLDIPRTTANYWIDSSLDTDDHIVKALTGAINEMKNELKLSRQQVAEHRALVQLLKHVFFVLGFRLRWKHIDEAQTRSQILDAVATTMTSASRSSCLDAVELSLSRYKRWRRERNCKLTKVKACPLGAPNQLTFKEVQTMKSLVTAKEYAHFPIRSLQYFAKKSGILFCSYTTWHKYIEQYKWKRPYKKYRPKLRKIGIRAKRPNEIWHLDVSYFVLPNKTKCFIQAIIDNYSRYVIAWQVLDSYDGSTTAALLSEALRRTYSLYNKSERLKLIVDGGGENRSNEVKDLETKGLFTKQVAHFEISFSNSMVETLFRSLKHNYLFHQEITALPSLRRHAGFWFKEHNEKIPHTAFNGETPLERYNQTWSKSDEIRILISQKEAIRLRIKENQKVTCEVCAEEN